MKNLIKKLTNVFNTLDEKPLFEWIVSGIFICAMWVIVFFITNE